MYLYILYIKKYKNRFPASCREICLVDALFIHAIPAQTCYLVRRMNTLDRRTLVKGIGSASALAAFSPSLVLREIERSYEASKDAFLELTNSRLEGEDFWQAVRTAYSASPGIINLNNGGVAPQPRVVQEAVEYYGRMCNEAPSYYMWRILDQGREPLREKLAKVAGCSPEEIAIDRNSSEALETVIFGVRLRPGDEVVLTKQDYPNMINAWKQRAHRDGISLKWVDLQVPSDNAEALAAAYFEKFSPRTRLVHITHVINWNGQVMPVQRIAAEAHKRGIEVLVDGAHSFAHLLFDIPSLGVDYFGTSLHKWMSAPFGSGMLYVKKEKIRQLYPLLAAPDPESDDIRKFENLGTRSFPIEQAISHAVDFFEHIGAKRKFDRLLELQRYWSSKVVDHPAIRLVHPTADGFSGALGNVSVQGKTPEEVSSKLFDLAKIHTVAISWENIHGVRITPNVYTTKTELDKLVATLLRIAGE
ncbi:MAG: hercynylcysteine sulfoxide lyase [Saprospiraceae bacterium]|jgi:selenocysteine lyase/cysteine desulfurase|nr:hercynylcysteine sulfoxide lyase [Saprospiraceae bacterium]